MSEYFPQHGTGSANEDTPEEWAERVDTFADPGGRSALRRAHAGNPRNRSCPTCGTPNVLTPADVAKGYQCDTCADAAEGLGGYGS